MKDSADIRKLNRKKILDVLCDGESYTKQQIAGKTGLSQATCNTLLNQMEKENIVIGKKVHLQQVGRASVRYHMNEEQDSILCVSFEIKKKKRLVSIWNVSLIGTIIDHDEQSYVKLDESTLLNILQQQYISHPNISYIVISTVSIAKDGIVKYSDIPELENADLRKKIEKTFGIQVCMENDMHLKAYGYYKKYCDQEDIVSLANFVTDVLPGTTTIYQGKVICGNDMFAGMVGFLPFDVSRRELVERLKKDTCRQFVSKSIISLISIMNPKKMILTGDLLDEKSISWIKKDCLKYIPKEYMPEFIYEEDINEYLVLGMYHKALDEKGQIK